MKIYFNISKMVVFCLVWLLIMIGLLGLSLHYNTQEWKYIDKGLETGNEKYLPIIDEYHEKCKKVLSIVNYGFYLLPLVLVLGLIDIEWRKNEVEQNERKSEI